MSIAKIISDRRTVHHFQHSEISADLIVEGLNLALTAPNHRLTFPWQFTVCGPQTRKKLRDLALRLKNPDGSLPAEPDSKQLERENQKWLNPASLVVFSGRQKPGRNEKSQQEDYAAIACAIQNFTLFMSSEGWGTKWSTGQVTEARETYQILGLNSQDYHIYGFVWVGQPSQAPAPQRRPQVHDVTVYLD